MYSYIRTTLVSFARIRIWASCIISVALLSLTTANAQKPTANPQSGCAPQQVSFTAPGGATTNTWNFGNGASAQNNATPSTVYVNPGDFTVTYTNSSGVADTIMVHVYPKPVAGFMPISPTDSCSGLTVNFQDTSTGGGGSAITAWFWTFGDGLSSPDQNPSHTFSSVNGSPYSISLVVTDANNCKNTFIDSALVHVSNLIPVITTTPNPASSCTAPFLVQFSGQTSSSTTGAPPVPVAITDYIWSFGNGNSSTIVTDTTTYLTEGVFTATLTVIDTFNCRKTVTKQVVINNPIADFDIVNDILNNDTVCQSVVFDNNSVVSGTFSYTWDFGDGCTVGPGTGNITNTPCVTGSYDAPQHSYANPNPYNQYIVSLIVSSSNLGLQCNDTLTDTIWVDGIRANFTSAPHYGCQMPFVATYDGSSSINAAQWQWTFSSNADNPIVGTQPGQTVGSASGVIVTDTINGVDTNEYTIHWMELADVELVVTSADGCIADTTAEKNDTIYKPTAMFFPDTINGCFPLSVIFYDSSQSQENIAQWFWDFGDGTNATVTDPAFDSIIHPFTQPGTHTVFLVITNDSNCVDTSYSIVINVGGPPNPSFSANPLSVCAGKDSVFFNDLTPVADSVDSWHYVTDGLLMWSCPDDPDPGYIYTSDVGFFDVTLIAESNGCYAETTITNMIEVKGPIAKARYEGNCPTPRVYNFFSDSAKGFTSLLWNFGDTPSGANNTSSLPNPTHTFTTRGDYTVTLIVTNSSSGCGNDTALIIVRVREIDAKIKTNAANGRDTLFCSGIAGQLSALPSIDVYGYCNRGYRWDWNDGTPPSGTDSPDIEHEFDTSGVISIRLIVTDTNGCNDTAYQNVIVHKIKAEFNMDTTVGYFGTDTLLICVPQTVQFTDSSYADTTIVSWSWTSDAIRLYDTVVVGFTQTSADTNPTFNYGTYNSSSNQLGVGYFLVNLVVSDTLGCKDSIRYYIKQSYPDSTFAATTLKQICNGQTVSFNASNEDTLVSWLWDFGDGDSDSIKAPTHLYDSAGSFTVSLITTDSVGCKGYRTFSNYVEVQDYPIAGIYITDNDNSIDTLVEFSDTLCYPKSLTFHDTTYIQYPTVSWSWTYPGGNNVPLKEPTATFASPTNYPVTLIVTSSFGCKDTLQDTLSLIGPVATLSVSDTSICLNDTINFSMTDKNDVFAWIWDFGDGSVDSSNTADTVTHIYTYHPDGDSTMFSLTIYDPGFLCPTPKVQTIHISNVKANFAINDIAITTDTAKCLVNNQASFTYTNQSTGIPNTWNWNFGNGTSLSGVGPHTQMYSAADTFKVGLFIKGTPIGSNKICVDTIYKEIIVLPNPTSTTVGGAACKDIMGTTGPTSDTISVIATGNGPFIYLWGPSTGLNNVNDSLPIASPTSTTTYTVTVTDANGCTDTETAQVTIYTPPPSKDTTKTIAVGELVQFNFDFGDYYSYTWAPETQWLSCTDCPNPTAQPMEAGSPNTTLTYQLSVQDTLGCFIVISTYILIVEPKDTLDVPDAFTPGVDGPNKIARVRGLGVKRVIEYKIYNRWGQVVFVAENFDINDETKGWDGTYLGKLQNMDTYVWYVKSEGYINSAVKEYKGQLLLIR